VARRSTPERIFQARRAATRNGLTDYGMPVEIAEAWCDEWQDEAERQGLERLTSAYWDDADKWIAEQRKSRRLPA